MSWGASKNTKCCITCSKWCGPRQLKMGRAETNSPGDRGKCTEGKGDAIPGPAASGGSSCNKYELWSALK